MRYFIAIASLLIFQNCNEENCASIAEKTFSSMQENYNLDNIKDIKFDINELKGVGLSNKHTCIDDESYYYLNKNLNSNNIFRIKGLLRKKGSIIFIKTEYKEQVMIDFKDSLRQIHIVEYGSGKKEKDEFKFFGGFYDEPTEDTLYMYQVVNSVKDKGENYSDSYLEYFYIYFSKVSGIVGLRYNALEIPFSIRFKPKVEVEENNQTIIKDIFYKEIK